MSSSVRSSAPRLSVTSVCAARPALAPELRLHEVERDRGREPEAVVHLAGSAALERHRADLLEVEHVRAEDWRHVHGARLEQILPAFRHEAAADERDVGRRVEALQLAHRVADEHRAIGRQVAARAAAQPGVATRAAAQSRATARKRSG